MSKKIIVLFLICVYISTILTIYYNCHSENDIHKTKVLEVKYKNKSKSETKTKNKKKAQNSKETKNKEKYVEVWTQANTDIRKEPKTNSKIVGKYQLGTKIKVAYINKRWARVKQSRYYIRRDFINKKPIPYNKRSVPSNNTIKSYMDYRAITLKSSRQYKLQQIAHTGKHGIRMVNGRYCVAVGSYYTTTIGQYIDIELKNGNVIHGILADCKADRHTDSTNRMHPDGSVVEFVVDTNRLEDMSRKMGDISYVKGWNSKVASIKVYKKVEKF